MEFTKDNGRYHRRIKNILDKFAIVFNGKFNNLDKLLSELASLIYIDEDDIIDTDQIFVKNKQSIDKYNISNNNGIGFNNDNMSMFKNHEIDHEKNKKRER